MPRREQGEPYYRISLDEADEMYKNGSSVVVDVRNPDEYESGHVKGAVLMSVDDVLSRIDELPTDKNLLFICAQRVRSGLACEMAAAMGIDTEKLFNIEEGTPAWISMGLPTTYGLE